MRYFFVIITLMFVIASNGYAKNLSYAQWISNEKALLPPYITIDFPLFNLQVDQIDQKELSLINDPNRRNQYINENYAVIAKELNQCLNTNSANWFHFAAWASRSAGEVISGKKFEDLKGGERYLMRAFGNWKKIYNEEKQIEIFASTNALIAMEMIPLGNLFLQLFCQGQKNSFDQFEKYFTPLTSAENFLYRAFENYHQVIHAKSERNKQELLLLASLYQLNAEQIRIDHLLGKVFWIKTKSKLVRAFFRRVATKKGKLEIGNKEIIDLTKKLPFLNAKKRKRVVIHQPLIDFFSSYNLPKVTEKNSLKVGTSNWSNIRSRMRFLSGFFWSYMISPSILASPSKNTKYLRGLTELKRLWNDKIYLPANDNLKETYDNVYSAWMKSFQSVGTIQSMKLRSDLFKRLYLENPSFYFGLSTAHLTLGIDRFASMGESLKRKFPVFTKLRMVDELNIWGDELRAINHKMTQLVLFSKDIFEMSKVAGLKKIISASSGHQLLFQDLIEIIPVVKLWARVEQEKDPERLMDVAGKFIEWEHEQVIRPRLEQSLLLVTERFENILKRIPGAIFEKTILRPFRVKTTINLECFLRPKYIRTKNFLDTSERIIRAKEFLKELQKIDFDPSMSCFNDPYYNY